MGGPVRSTSMIEIRIPSVGGGIDDKALCVKGKGATTHVRFLGSIRYGAGACDEHQENKLISELVNMDQAG